MDCIYTFVILTVSFFRVGQTINIGRDGTYYKEYKGQRLDTTMVDVIEARSDVECVMRCRALADRCNGAEWQPPFTCHLMDDGGYGGNLTDKLVSASSTKKTVLVYDPSKNTVILLSTLSENIIVFSHLSPLKETLVFYF